MNVAILLISLAVSGALAFIPWIRDSRAWKATVTPLASIMGSGFLVSAPLVAAEAGVYSPFVMAALLLVAFALGSMIRFNIRYAEPPCEGGSESDRGEHRAHRGHSERTRPHWTKREQHIARVFEQLSHVVLAGAYVVSISYYLQLLAAFVLDRFGVHSLTWSRLATTATLLLIGGIGAAWGLKALERVETYAVSLNLGMIAALLVALIVHDATLAAHGDLAMPALVPDPDRARSIRIVMGLLIVVQGFETSRFLGAEHPAEERVQTMRIAQIVASVIYLAFVTLMLPLFGGQVAEANVTAIVGLVAPVAALLPILIVVAAVGSQFSAAVADDAGCAGLLGAFFGDRLDSRWSYLMIGVATIGVTWLTDVLSVISLASRAFALFYALQCVVAAVTAYARDDAPRRRWIMGAAGVLALVSLSVTVLGIPAE